MEWSCNYEKDGGESFEPDNNNNDPDTIFEEPSNYDNYGEEEVSNANNDDNLWILCIKLLLITYYNKIIFFWMTLES